MIKNFKKTIAFTLAETLIVMGIIGIVSALTLPNLNSSTGEKEKIAKVKKLYQNLDDAYGRARAVYGPLEDWTKTDSTSGAKATRIGERMTEFMKVSKTCGTATNKGCFSNKNLLNYRGANSAFVSWDQVDTCYKVILADGSTVRFCSTGNMDVDIDGPNKGKNQIGLDLFRFNIDSNNGVSPQRVDNFSNYLAVPGFNLSGWVIDYDNMDYLKLDTSGKCPNGTAPTEQNPRCK